MNVNEAMEQLRKISELRSDSSIEAWNIIHDELERLYKELDQARKNK